MRYLLLIILAVIFAACDTQETPSPLPTSTTVAPTALPTATFTPSPTNTPAFIPSTNADTPENQAYLRVVHAVPGIESIDAYIEARSLAFNLPYATYTEPVGIAAGDYMLRIQASGSRLHEVEPFIEQTVTVPGLATLVIVFTGTTEAPSVLLFTESNRPLESETSRINLVHAVQSGPQQVTLQHNGVDLTSPLDYSQLSNPVELSSMETALFLQSGDMTLLDASTNLRERFNYTWIMVQDPENPNGVSLVRFFNRVPGRTQLRVIHAAETIGAIDVYTNTSPFTSELTFGNTSERRVVPATGYTVEVYEAGADPSAVSPLTTARFNANEDSNIALFLLGTPENLQLVRHLEDLTPLPPGQARITFANAMNTSGSARVEYSGGRVEGVPDLAYRQISPPVQVTGDTVGFYWSIYANNVQGDTVESVDNVTIEPGQNYVYIMTGRTDGSLPVLLSEEIGIDEMLAEPIEIEPIGDPFSVRFINALGYTAQVAFLVDGSSTDPVGNWQVSPSITFLENEETAKEIVVVDLSTGQEIASTSYAFLSDSDYNIYVYGTSTTSSGILIAQNGFATTEGSEFANIRLVNVSQSDDVLLRLDYDDATDEPFVAPPDETAVASGEARFRSSLPPGTQPLTGTTESRTASFLGLIPFGINDLYVVDTSRRSIAATIPAYSIEDGFVYEVIAFQSENSLQVTAFVVTYPKPTS